MADIVAGNAVKFWFVVVSMPNQRVNQL